jgi:uncharacterized protein (DUF2147 family)
MRWSRTALRFGMAAGQSILGAWLVEDREAAVETCRPCGEELRGRIAWLKETRFPADDESGMAGEPKTDRNDPIVARRAVPVPGSTVLRGLRFNGGCWKHGRLYDPETGSAYTFFAALTPENRLEIRGCPGFSVPGRTVVWTRSSRHG